MERSSGDDLTSFSARPDGRFQVDSEVKLKRRADPEDVESMVREQLQESDECRCGC
jgi:hypothetical protein